VLLVETEIMNSAIHGQGLFARNDIRKGTKVWEFNPLFDIVLDETLIDDLPEVARTFLKIYAYRSIQTNELIVNLDMSKHMNHSNNPNLVPDASSSYYAIVDIPKGTELTCDYRVFSVDGTSDF
jgi:SET domain-containing protein